MTADEDDRRVATVALFAYDNLDRCRLRLARDLLPSLAHYPGWRFELIVIDNSPHRLDPLADEIARLPWKSRYLWHNGTNLRYGPSMNLAARLAEHPYLLYACTSHGRMFDRTWIEDLIRPMWDDERIAMCGYLFPSAEPGVLGFADRGQRRVHVQGGVLAARTEVIRRVPYQEAEWAHGGSDVWHSYRLMQEGLTIQNVPTIYSTGLRIPSPAGTWKYVHDYSEDG